MKKSKRNRNRQNNQTKVQETKITQTVNNEVPVTEEDIALKNAVISNIENSEVDEKKEEATQPKSNATNGLLDSLTKKVNSIVEETVKSNKTEPVETKAPAVEPITVKCEYDRDNAKLKVYTTGEPFVLSLQTLPDEYSPVGEALPEAAFREMVIYMERIFFNVIPKFLNPCAVIPASQFDGFRMTNVNGSKLLATNEFKCFDSIKKFKKTKIDDRSNYVVYKFEPHAVDEFIAFASDANDSNLLLPLIGEITKLTDITTIDKMTTWMIRKPSDSDRELKESSAIIAVELDEAFKNSEYSLDINTVSVVHNGEEVDDFWEISSIVDIANIDEFLSIEEFVDAFGLSLDNIDNAEDEDGDDEDLEDYDDDEIDEDDEEDDSDDEFSIGDMLDEDDDEDNDMEEDEEDEDEDLEDEYDGDEDDEPDDNGNEFIHYYNSPEDWYEGARRMIYGDVYDDIDDWECDDMTKHHFVSTIDNIRAMCAILVKYYFPGSSDLILSVDIADDNREMLVRLQNLGLQLPSYEGIDFSLGRSDNHSWESRISFNFCCRMTFGIMQFWIYTMKKYFDRSDVEMTTAAIDEIAAMIANASYALLAYGLVDNKDLLMLNLMMVAYNDSEDGAIKISKIRRKAEVILKQKNKLIANLSKSSDASVMTVLAQLAALVTTNSYEVFDPPTVEGFKFSDEKAVTRFVETFSNYLLSNGIDRQDALCSHFREFFTNENESDARYGTQAIQFLIWLYDDSKLNKLKRYF